MDTTTSTAPPAQPLRLRRYADLPGPRGIPLLGNVLQIDSTRVHLQLEQWAREYGRIYRLQLGNRRALVVTDHEVLTAVLRDRPDNFRRSDKFTAVMEEMGMPSGLFNVNDEAWKRQRLMVMAGFNPAHVKRYFPAMQGVTDRLVGRWRKAASSGAEIDLQADLMRYTVDTVAGLAFGEMVNTLESDTVVIQQHLDKLLPALFARLFAPLPVWRWWTSAKDRALAHSVAEVKAAVADFIAKARARLQADPARREHPQNLLEAMIVAAEAPGSDIDDEQVAGNVLTLLIAGEDTTANSVAWLIEQLWRHPEHLRRATEEVRAAMSAGHALSQEQLSHLPFVDACVNESMRLRPVVPVMFVQVAHDDTDVAGVRMPAGSLVIGLMRHDSVREPHVKNPEVFAPERWMAAADAPSMQALRHTSMPFGAGPRICPGRYLALLEIKLAIAALLGHFEIENLSTPDGREAAEFLALTMAPVGLKMRLRVA